MNRTMNLLARFAGAALAAGLALAAAPAIADKPEWAGKVKGKPAREARDHHDRDAARRTSLYFDARDRELVRVYFAERERGGWCPPGLAKKRNGCMPPGQARKWAKGRPLARDVVYHELPYELEVRLGLPPAGHKYVRVAADILLVAVGTSMVIDAIEDLGRL